MTRVVAFGTFDIFHPGHISFFNQAKKLGGYLLIVVARDKNVETIKGHLPKNLETKRARAIRKTKLPNKVILGSKTNNYFQTLRTYKIDLIALGYDQKPSVTELKRQLKRHRLTTVVIKRLKPYNPSKYKSSLLSP